MKKSYNSALKTGTEILICFMLFLVGFVVRASAAGNMYVSSELSSATSIVAGQEVTFTVSVSAVSNECSRLGGKLTISAVGCKAPELKYIESSGSVLNESSWGLIQDEEGFYFASTVPFSGNKTTVNPTATVTLSFTVPDDAVDGDKITLSFVPYGIDGSGAYYYGAPEENEYKVSGSAYPVSLRINNANYKSEYRVGESFDVSQMDVVVVYSNGTVKSISSYDVSPSAFEANDTEVRISYSEAGYTVITSLPVTVSTASRVLKSLEITEPPAKTSYEKGEAFSPEGMVVSAVYTDGSKGKVLSYTVSPSSALTEDTTSVTVSYTENGITVSAVQPVSVGRKLLSIAVTEMPSKTRYVAGEKFDPAGMTVTASYTTGQASVITDYTYTPDSELTSGIINVKLSYTEGGITAETEVQLLVDTVSPSSLKIVSPPVYTDYIEGDSFDKTGLRIDVVYNNGTQAEITDFVCIPEVLDSKTEAVTFVYTENEKSCTASVRVYVVKQTGEGEDYSLARIYLASLPDKTEYTEGETFDSTGMVLKAVYSNRTEITLTEYSVSPSVALTENDTQVTFTYSYGPSVRTLKLPVNVTKPEPEVTKTLTRISVSKKPTRTSYLSGELFDSDGMVVTAAYSDGSAKEITDYTYNPKTPLTAADNKITVSYTDGDVTKTVSFTIKVEAPAESKLKSLTVVTPPSKTEYKAGEAFDPSGLVLLLKYSDGSEENVTKSFTYSPSKALTVADLSVRISYKSGSDTVYTDIPITVSPSSPEERILSYIAVTSPPSSLIYKAGDTFSESGMQVTAYYTDGTSRTVTSYTCYPTVNLAEGTSEVTVTYSEGGTKKSASQPITVLSASSSDENVDKKVLGILISSLPLKTVYNEGEVFDPTGMVVVANYSETDTEPVAEYTVSPERPLTEADKSVTVTARINGTDYTTSVLIWVTGGTAVSEIPLPTEEPDVPEKKPQKPQVVLPEEESNNAVIVTVIVLAVVLVIVAVIFIFGRHKKKRKKSRF